jgi:hypothetical protein
MVAVVIAQGLLNLQQRLGGLRAGLLLPNQLESLATEAAMRISVPICALESDFHAQTSKAAGLFQPQGPP